MIFAAINSQAIFLIVILIAVFALPYFTISKPQKKQQEQRRNMLNELKKGDEIMTVGGFIGVIEKVLNDSFVIKMNPDNIKLEIRKDSILKKMEEEVAAVPEEDEYDVIVDDDVEEEVKEKETK